jgi:hypothetical protein
MKKAKRAPQTKTPSPSPEKRDEDKLLDVEEADGQDLQEVESELGISQWIDPDTGDPAEDSVPRLEDH